MYKTKTYKVKTAITPQSVILSSLATNQVTDK